MTENKNRKVYAIKHQKNINRQKKKRIFSVKLLCIRHSILILVLDLYFHIDICIFVENPWNRDFLYCFIAISYQCQNHIHIKNKSIDCSQHKESKCWEWERAEKRWGQGEQQIREGRTTNKSILKKSIRRIKEKVEKWKQKQEMFDRFCWKK